MRKLQLHAVFALAALAIFVLAASPASAQGPKPSFTALALAQLETIHYQAHVYLKQMGRYPKNLQELRNSPYWVVEVGNGFTGKPIQQIPFTPREQDYAKNDALPEGEVFAPLEPDTSALPPPDGGSQQQPPPIPGAAGRPGQRVMVQGRRIDPSRITFPSAGDIIYYQDGDSLQLLLFDDGGRWEELWVAKPFNYRAAMLETSEKVRPETDFLVAEVATHLEQMLPNMYSRMLFLTDQQPATPVDLRKRLPGEFEKMAAALGLTYKNPIKGREFMRADYYSPGDLSSAQWLQDKSGEMMYFLEANRARSLNEITDKRVYQERLQVLQRRDKLVKAHAGDVPGTDEVK
jgi:hypothetical protein